jgi:hypothetical protein
LAAGFYLPLYRAHKELTAEYAALGQKTQVTEQELAAARAELAAVKAKRDELEARRGMDQNRERASHELVEQIKADVTTKLARFLNKGTLTISTHRNLVVVHIPNAIAETATKTDVTGDARLALCTLSGVAATRGAVDLRIVSRDAGSAESDKTRTPWDLAAERSAAAARTLVDKCKYSPEHVEVAVRAQTSTDPNGKTSIDVEIDPGSGAALTAL